MNDQIDTLNQFAVGLQGEHIVVLMPPRHPMTKIEGLTFAAWLVAMAHPQDRADFLKILDAVENT